MSEKLRAEDVTCDHGRRLLVEGCASCAAYSLTAGKLPAFVDPLEQLEAGRSIPEGDGWITVHPPGVR